MTLKKAARHSSSLEQRVKLRVAFKFQGLDQRLTGVVAASVVKGILA